MGMQHKVVRYDRDRVVNANTEPRSRSHTSRGITHASRLSPRNYFLHKLVAARIGAESRSSHCTIRCIIMDFGPAFGGCCIGASFIPGPGILFFWSQACFHVCVCVVIHLNWRKGNVSKFLGAQKQDHSL